MRLLEGRWISSQDTEQSQPVVVVDEHLARRFFPGRSAIGGRIKRAPYDSAFPWRTIVGVVADVREEGDYHEGWYLPYAQDATGPSAEHVHAMVRVDGDPLALVAQARSAVADIDDAVAPFDFATMDRIRTESLQQDRLGTVLVVVFAGLGLLLAAVGVYGLMAFLVAQQTREMGIRVALGAPPPQLLRDVLRRGLWLTVAGVGIGLAGSLAATPLLGRLVDGVSTADPRVLSVSVAVLAAASLLACAGGSRLTGRSGRSAADGIGQAAG